MSSVAPPQDAIAAPAPKKKNKKAKKPKKPIDTNSKDGDSPTADQQPSPSPRDNDHHDRSAGDDEEPSTPVVSPSMLEAAHQPEHSTFGTHLRLVDTSLLPAYTVVHST